MVDNIDLQNFIEKFSPKVIEKLSGIDLLKLIAYPKYTDNNIKEQFKNLYEDNYVSLKNELENGMVDFGSGSAGYDINFVLAYRQGDWYNKKRRITFEEAIQIAEQIKQELVTACNFLNNNDFNSFYNYTTNSQSGLFNKGYTHKYFHILYPRYITFYHAGTWQQYYKQCLKLPQTQNYYDIEKYFLDNDSSCNVGEKSRELEKEFGVPTKRTWLLTWNPNKWHWESFEKDVDNVDKGIDVESKYSCHSKKPRIGDRAFVLKLGENLPKGIIASGYVSHEPYMDIAEHTDDNKEMNCIKIKFDKIINFNQNEVLLQDILKKELPGQEWSPQSSGIEVKREIADKLEELWQSVNDNSKSSSEVNMSYENVNNIPLNQILYGPPGTGKTYNTIIEAMKILTFEGLFSDWYLKVYCVTKNVDSKEKTLNDYIKHLNKINTEFLKNDNIFRYYKPEEFTKIKKYILDSNYITDDFTKNNNNSYYKHGLRRYEEFLNWLTYDKIREKYKEYKSLGQIEFVTFHQSYSYEEFVEGIKPYLDSESWDEPVENLTYQGTNGLFKTISNLALFERLNITNQEQEAVTDFKHVKNLFIEEYEIGSTLKTKTKETEFRIDKYTDKSVRITPINGKCTYSITFKYLEEAFSKDMKTQDEIAKINGVASGLSCYYYSIYEKLLEIKKSNNKNLNQNKKLTNNEKLQLVKDYYDRKITLKNNDKSKPYVLIIDEINRGNISKIFGELITLIEEDKRENLTVTLPYSKELFTVPKNLYILGTMNTSDRSIASIDIALRRRFKFKELMPKSNMVSDFKCKFKDCFELLNKRISVLLDRDHQIGHSYFIKDKHQNDGINELKNIWFDSILPLLNEYFYGDWEKLQALLGQAKNDNTSFIKKIEKISFANSYSCDESENYDFTSESECNFEFAMKNAFGNNFEV